MDQRSRAEQRKESNKSVGGWGEMANCCGCSGARGHARAQPKNPFPPTCPSSRGLHSPGGGTPAAVEMVGVRGTWEGGVARSKQGKISQPIKESSKK
jgi:hypothetical protein